MCVFWYKGLFREDTSQLQAGTASSWISLRSTTVLCFGISVRILAAVFGPQLHTHTHHTPARTHTLVAASSSSLAGAIVVVVVALSRRSQRLAVEEDTPLASPKATVVRTTTTTTAFALPFPQHECRSLALGRRRRRTQLKDDGQRNVGRCVCV